MKKQRPTKEEAERAIHALNKLRYLLLSGKISYDAAKEFAEPHLTTFNNYSPSKQKITFSSFMR